MLPFREAVPLAEEVGRILPGAELAVPSSVVGELENLLRRRAPHAASALALARRLRTLPTEDRGDAAVEELAVRLRATVVTADRGLAERLRRQGVAVLVPRDRTRLELRWPLPTAPDDRTSRRRAARPKG